MIVLTRMVRSVLKNDAILAKRQGRGGEPQLFAAEAAGAGLRSVRAEIAAGAVRVGPAHIAGRVMGIAGRRLCRRNLLVVSGRSHRRRSEADEDAGNECDSG